MAPLFAETDEPKESCVYAHWRPDKRAYFYVGKGVGDRYKIGRPRSDHHKRVVEKLRKAGLEPEVHFIARNITDDDAKKIEIQTIAAFRALGHPLVNKTDGGDGNRGYKPTDEAKAKISAANKGRKRPQKAIDATAAANRGRVTSQEQKDKLSIANTGKKRTPETCARISAAKKGVKPSPETVAKSAASRCGGKRSDETKERMSKAQKGRVVSEETKAILAEIARNMPQEQKDKISKSLTGRKLSPEHAEKARKAGLGRKNTPEQKAKMSEAARKAEVYCVTNGITYPSMRAAAAELGIHETAVSMACRGVRKNAAGYVFRYADGR